MKGYREYGEDEFLPLSGIQHFAFCRRQWALIHIEQQWADNALTVKGNNMHRKAHDTFGNETRKDIVISRGMPVHSRTLGISGICDIVEFHKSKSGTFICSLNGTYDVLPVEYKRGRPKNHDADILQVVAQAMCLEEMLCTEIPKASLYYGETHHRMEIFITREIRNKVMEMCAEMHEYFARAHTPKCKAIAKCKSCSLIEICNPDICSQASVSAYIEKMLDVD